MLTHRGFSAWIVSGDQPLQEHLVAVDEENHRVSCWVPSEPGRPFVVYWRDHGGDIDTCAFITLDGFVVPGRFLFGSGVAFRKGVRTGQATERPFVFSKIEEMPSFASSEYPTKDLGMIMLKIKRIERVGGRIANPIQQVPDKFKGDRPLGELYISFGAETTAYTQHSTTWSVKPYPMDKISSSSDKPNTHVTFVFRYRSIEFLKAQGIISDNNNPPRTRRNVRRVASAPPLPSAASPSTPSPAPSPRWNLKSPVMQALSHGIPRSRDTRRVASLRGVSTQNDRLPGQGFIRFDEQERIGEEGKDDIAATQVDTSNLYL